MYIKIDGKGTGIDDGCKESTFSGSFGGRPRGSTTEGLATRIIAGTATAPSVAIVTVIVGTGTATAIGLSVFTLKSVRCVCIIVTINIKYRDDNPLELGE